MEAAAIIQAVGLAAGGGVALLLWRRSRGEVETAIHLLVLASPLVMIGGKAWHLILLGEPLTWMTVTGPGYSLFGSVALVLAFWFAMSRIFSFPLARFLDAVTPGAALGLAIGRISCFIRGCCGGSTCDLPWAVRFDPGTAVFAGQVRVGALTGREAASLPVHPTQLYESAFALLAFWWLLRLHGRGSAAGRVFLSGTLAYGVFRFLLEFWKPAHDSAIQLGPFTAAQLTSIVMVLGAGLALLVRRKSRMADSTRVDGA